MSRESWLMCKPVFRRAWESPGLWLPSPCEQTPAALGPLRWSLWGQQRLREHEPKAGCWWPPAPLWPLSQDLGIMVSSSNTNVIGELDEAPNLVLTPTAHWLFPSCEKTESIRFNKRSEWCTWETSDNDKLTADLFLKAKSVSQISSYWLSSAPQKAVAFLIRNLKTGLNALLNCSLVLFQCLQGFLQERSRASRAMGKGKQIHTSTLRFKRALQKAQKILPCFRKWA